MSLLTFIHSNYITCTSDGTSWRLKCQNKDQPFLSPMPGALMGGALSWSNLIRIHKQKQSDQCLHCWLLKIPHLGLVNRSVYSHDPGTSSAVSQTKFLMDSTRNSRFTCVYSGLNSLIFGRIWNTYKKSIHNVHVIMPVDNPTESNTAFEPFLWPMRNLHWILHKRG